MVKVYAGTDKEFYIDGILKSNFDLAKEQIKKDWDMVFIVDGYEGTGKSVLAQQLATYCDPGFIVDRITFSPEGFTKACKESGQYEAVIYDEAYTGLSSRGAMSSINRALVAMLAEIRQKNLYVFIVMPTFFDLDKYPALHRSRALIHVYTGQNFERGYFAFYNVDRKKDLYMKGKKFYQYFVQKPNFYGRFTNHYTVDKEEYKKRKLEAMRENEGKGGYTVLSAKQEQRDKIIINCLNSNMSVPDIAKVTGVSERTIYRKADQLREMLLNKPK